jgi:hypothetical protein
MKPKYDSNYEPDNLAAHRQDETTRMEHEESETMHDAGESALAPEQIANAALREGCGESSMEQSKIPIPLPGFSIAQTEFFYALQKRCAKHSLALTVAPDGGMYTGEIDGSHDGNSHSWGSIHDPRFVFKLIPTMYDATLGLEEVISLMFKLFPRSTELGFLFRSKGDK